jgi:N-methylhydantoinase A
MSPGENKPSTALLAVDTGGTFTDFLLLSDGRLRTLKLPSTPHDPAEAVLQGIQKLIQPGADFVLLHGSTVATNALLERKGARVSLVTNRGFEDLIEIGRQNRPQLYALVGWRLPPLVERDDRFGISAAWARAGRKSSRSTLASWRRCPLVCRAPAPSPCAFCTLMPPPVTSAPWPKRSPRAPRPCRYPPSCSPSTANTSGRPPPS